VRSARVSATAAAAGGTRLAWSGRGLVTHKGRTRLLTLVDRVLEPERFACRVLEQGEQGQVRATTWVGLLRKQAVAVDHGG